MGQVIAEAPFWINIRNGGIFTCEGCGAVLQRGDSAQYHRPTQRYLKCHRCDDSGPAPEPAPTIDPPTAEAPAPMPPAVVSPAPVAPLGSVAGLVAAVEAFARNNCRSGVDYRAVADKVLASIVRTCAAE